MNHDAWVGVIMMVAGVVLFVLAVTVFPVGPNTIPGLIGPLLCWIGFWEIRDRHGRGA